MALQSLMLVSDCRSKNTNHNLLSHKVKKVLKFVMNLKFLSRKKFDYICGDIFFQHAI